MKRNWVIAAAFASGLLLGGAGVALGQAAASREILKTLDVAGTDREASLGTANLPEGSAIAPHYHPGEELAFVADGQVVLKIEGQADRLLKAGDSYAIPRGMVHSAAPPAGQSARVVAVWITDKGQPLAVPAG
ncbi:MAG: cupin domain-containing protein [Caulobacteraceae bacterium]